MFLFGISECFRDGTSFLISVFAGKPLKVSPDPKAQLTADGGSVFFSLCVCVYYLWPFCCATRAACEKTNEAAGLFATFLKLLLVIVFPNCPLPITLFLISSKNFLVMSDSRYFPKCGTVLVTVSFRSLPIFLLRSLLTCRLCWVSNSFIVLILSDREKSGSRRGKSGS